jgi:AraC-like DNA-binding protein
MLHLLPRNKFPLKYISSGNLISEDGFIHPKRNLDTFVLLFGVKGNMYITQGNSQFVLSPNTYVILFPGMEHCGTKPSQGELSYLWCHFQITNRGCDYLQTADVIQLINNTINERRENLLLDVYILSEFGTLSEHGRTEQLFHQLLDIAKERAYSHFSADYALSLLVLEISNQFFRFAIQENVERTKTKNRIYEITEWLRTNYTQSCSLQELAERFNYHPAYLSASFKRSTGITLVKYITKLRIASAKRLLLKTEMSVAQIASACGFTDDKHFMKVFKAQEFTTPSQYRYSFVRKKINSK